MQDAAVFEVILHEPFDNYLLPFLSIDPFPLWFFENNLEVVISTIYMPKIPNQEAPAIKND